MKNTEKANLTIPMSLDAERILEDFQMSLRQQGVKRSTAKKGRIIEELVLMPGAFDYLKDRLA